MSEPNLFEAMTEFHNIAQAVAFHANEIALFHALSHTWNVARRPAVIEQWAEITARNAGLTKDTLPAARNKLVQTGVLFFDKAGNRSVPRYSLNALFGLDSPFDTRELQRDIRSNTRSNTRVSDGVNGVSYQVEGKAKKKDSPLPPDGGIGGGDLIPKTPQPYDEERRAMPANKPRAAIEKKRVRVKVNTPTMIRLNSWFGRQSETLWTVAELEALIQIAPNPKELDGMEAYYVAANVGERDIRRRDLLTLLNNWSGELDRARVFYLESKKNR